MGPVRISPITTGREGIAKSARIHVNASSHAEQLKNIPVYLDKFEVRIKESVATFTANVIAQ